MLLKEHLEKYYRSRNRKWIVLFPEGGFLRKRRETSQAFAKKNNLPFLKHVTLPRLGATQVILKTLVAPQENGTPAGRGAVIKGKDHFTLVDKKQIECQRSELSKTFCVDLVSLNVKCIHKAPSYLHKCFIFAFSSTRFIFYVETHKKLKP